MEVSLTIYIRIRVRQHLPHCGLCSRKQRNDEKWEHSSHDVETRRGGGGAVPGYKYVHNNRTTSLLEVFSIFW